MNRLFHAKISLGNYVLLSALLAVAIYFVWQAPLLPRQALGILICVILLIMVIIVERMINTTYTLTADGTLVIHKGRFSKDIIVNISDIKKTILIDRWKLFGHSIYSYILIEVNDNTSIIVRPNNEYDFIHKIEKIKNDNSNDDEEED